MCGLFALIIPANIPVAITDRSTPTVCLFFSVRAGGAEQAALGFPVGRHGALDAHSAAIAGKERHGHALDPVRLKHGAAAAGVVCDDVEIHADRRPMNRVVLAVLFTCCASAAMAADGYQPIDRIDGWLVERRLDSDQTPVCRASIPEGGTWFSARVRINVRDVLVVPEGFSSPDASTVEMVRSALKRCRESLLYL